MEKAILKTLIYADIFDYPLKAWEIHKWLIGKKASLKQVEKTLGRLSQKSRRSRSSPLAAKVKSQKGYYFLHRRDSLVGKRLIRARESRRYLQQAQLVSQLFKLIPWIKLVGISGNLAMDNASKIDDIDLVIVTAKNRLWLSRICLLVLLELVGKRRKKTDSKRKAAGKLCVNLLLDEDSLAQISKDIYLAHEVLQMKPLWYRENLYQKYLEENSWAFKFLPNWISSSTAQGPVSSVSHLRLPAGKASPGGLTRHAALNRRDLSSAPTSAPFILIDWLENIAKWWQLRYMGQPVGQERISATALYFHPQDYRPQVLKEYQRRIKKLDCI